MNWMINRITVLLYNYKQQTNMQITRSSSWQVVRIWNTLFQVLQNVRIVFFCSIAVAFELISSLHAECGVSSFCKLVSFDSMQICQVAATFYLRGHRKWVAKVCTVSQSGHNYPILLIHTILILKLELVLRRVRPKNLEAQLRQKQKSICRTHELWKHSQI